MTLRLHRQQQCPHSLQTTVDQLQLDEPANQERRCGLVRMPSPESRVSDRSTPAQIHEAQQLQPPVAPVLFDSPQATPLLRRGEQHLHLVGGCHCEPVSLIIGGHYRKPVSLVVRRDLREHVRVSFMFMIHAKLVDLLKRKTQWILELGSALIVRPTNLCQLRCFRCQGSCAISD